MEIRTQKQPIKAIEQDEQENKDYIIEGYFIVFNEFTEIGKGAYEMISPNAVSEEELKGDIRFLVNHNPSEIYGRTTNGTLTLTKDEVGVYGRINLNKEDPEAMSLYAKVKRGDINQASFGGNANHQIVYSTEGGRVYEITDLSLRDVSVATFPAYQHTAIITRSEKPLIERQKEKIKEILNNGN